MAAFENAIGCGCDGFEFDVRLTGDEKAVVCHNAKSRGLLLAKTDSARLAQLAGLHDVISRFSKRAFFDIELKVPGLGHHVLSALRERPPERGYVISSFLPEVLIDLRVRSETVPLGLIYEKKKTRWEHLPVSYLIPHHSLVTEKLIAQAREAGKHVLAWTVNDARSMLRLAKWGVDGIISDKPELLVKTLRGTKKPN